MDRRAFIKSTLIAGTLTPQAALAMRAGASTTPGKPGALREKWGDQGDGSFVNPVLPADYSDIDVIRVGDTFVAISSTIHVVPGMVVLTSRDLVNWTTVSHAVMDTSVLGGGLGWREMGAAGRGVWAGSIRYHDSRYWVYFTCPDSGIFVTTAHDPAGPWSPLACVLAKTGFDDPCPFWDDDGQGYLITTHFAFDPATGRDYDIHLFKMRRDGLGLEAGFDHIVHHSKGSEANKLYKIGGRYYHYYSEIRPEGRVPMLARADTLTGRWQRRQLLHVAPQIDKEPNQGGLVQTEGGAWWFLTHQGTGDWEGRAMCLLPVRWARGWPLLGTTGADGIGHMTWRCVKPIVGPPRVRPDLSDDFKQPILGPQWEWNHAPRAEMWSLVEHPGRLRLHAFPPVRIGDVLAAGNTVSQRSWRTAYNRVTVELLTDDMVDGEVAGLMHFSKSFAMLGIEQHGGVRQLLYRDSADRLERGPALGNARVWLRSAWRYDGLAMFSFSMDGVRFQNLGIPYQLTWGDYRGDRIGICNFNGRGAAGSVDVAHFEYLIADQNGIFADDPQS